ncbi:TonB-dependent receptor plug domain-containing protein [Longitalea luteola]|uniref:TonB-dependent receptor plug domain-containing protein n=1 Tax=Longitalea luteola TaxID=2812563 RepID=UPI001A95907F|nr:TonB-dependent receptor [Longitalea luteola]
MLKRLLTFSILGLGYQAFAQDSVSTKQLGEVIVTANKLAQKQSTTGKVITVITKEQLEKSSGRTVGQLLNEQAGVSVNGSLNNIGTNQSVYVRGAATGRILILLDGIPVYDPSLSGNEFDLNLLSIHDVERIEIARGAQSTMYGSDAVAGVINIITVKQDVSKPINVKATLSGGSYNTFRGNIQLYGKAGKVSYSAKYSKLTSDGFSTAYDSSHNNGFDKDGFNSDVASASMQFQATANLLFKGYIQYSRNKTDIDDGAFVDEKDYTLTNKNVFTGAGFNYRKNNVNITGNYAYNDFTRNQLNDSTDVPGFTTFANFDFYGRSHFIEAYANISLGSGFTWLQGADYRFSSMNSQSLSISPYGAYPENFNDTSHSQASLYSSLFYNGRDEKLNIELGGRMNVHSKYGSNYTYTFNPSYNFTKQFRVFGSFATAFKAPTLYQLYSSYGLSTLEPERSTTFEAGAQFSRNNSSVRIVYFDRHIKDGIDFDYINYKYFNSAKQNVQGMELEASIKPVNALTIMLNYTYLDPKEQIQSRETFKDTAYHYLLRRPKHNLNITAGYQFNNGLYISANGKYVSKRYDVGGYQMPDLILDGYFLLGAYAEYKFPKHLKVFADARNITDKQFFDIRGYNSMPFLLTAGFIFNW